jgi:eukaryotic-like serine/threonine-protein kinase
VHTDTVLDDALIGSMLGKDYRVIEKIGRGGMASVYLVEHQTLAKQFAAKVLSEQLAANTEARTRFAQEAHSASQLDHEHIVSISDFGVTPDRRPYFVMELLRGQTLDQRMTAGPMSLEEIVAVAVPLARALAYAHAEGIVHRDIKPENVFLVQRSQNRWTVKVVDFGIAKTPTSDKLTKMGQTLGSPYFMSPEACRGDEVDHRADIYSFGILLYVMLCGRLPFDDESLLKVLRMQVSTPLPAPRAVNPQLLPGLEAILERALAKDAAVRYASMEALLIDLEAALPPGSDRLLIEQHNGTSAAFRFTPFPGATVSQQVRTMRDTQQAQHPPAPRRTPWLAIGAGLLALGTLGGLGAMLMRSSDETAKVGTAQGASTASIDVTSTPSGAAIFVGGEPTGLTTPAKLPGLTAGRIAIRVELADYLPETKTFEVAAGSAARHAFELHEAWGRVALAGLPIGTTIRVRGEEHTAGEVITLPVGKHEIRLQLGADQLLQQTIETISGHQVWELRDHELVRK